MDDAITKIFGAVLAALSGVGIWLVKSTLGNREKLLVHGQKFKSLEDRMEKQEEKKGVTAEEVRKVIKQENAERDARAAELQAEREKRYTAEIKQTISEEVRAIMREFRSDGGMGGGRHR